jgi:hypothetical protein
MIFLLCDRLREHPAPSANATSLRQLGMADPPGHSMWAGRCVPEWTPPKRRVVAEIRHQECQ